MSARSAGLVLFRRTPALEVFLIHPGGPFWAKKDLGAWSIPKGGIDPDEDPLACARRELLEETGFAVDGEPIALGSIRQAAGKVVEAWAVEADVDPAKLVSATFAMEWPPRSGRQAEFPEADRGAWFTIEEARRRIIPAQGALLDRLAVHLASGDR